MACIFQYSILNTRSNVLYSLKDHQAYKLLQSYNKKTDGKIKYFISMKIMITENCWEKIPIFYTRNIIYINLKNGQ